MITDTRFNRVYFSALLPEACPVTYKGLVEVLDRYDVSHALLNGTKDIWCRDYMPVQTCVDGYAAFTYRPDYLLDTTAHRASITDSLAVTEGSDISGQLLIHGIKVDGGNTVHSEHKVIMTTKVFCENPGVSACKLTDMLENAFLSEVVFVPWDTTDIYGHTDGICRIIDEGTVLMTNYAQFDPLMAKRIRQCLKPHFSDIVELHFNTARPHMYSWAYVNWLQTDCVLIIPKFGIPEDDHALEQISALMPDYAGRIEQVDARDLIRYEGCLNCASWTVYHTIM